ncbi:MAG TPA: T9SS type A sorting domain-containing protein [candidate division Zixibacteria bacterium]|nr:T9SS type A sorting domain-containing protein [candidate division Zixibacteria bacterium]
MRKTLTITAVAAVVFLGTLAVAGDAYGFTGRVTVGQINADPGMKIGLPVYLGGNDQAITGFRLPLRYNSNDLTPDSVSLIGSLVDPLMTEIESKNADSGYFGVTLLPPFSGESPRITADSGLLATFWFTVSPGAGSQAVIVDSLNTVDTVAPGNPPIVLLRRLEFVDTLATSLIPQFTPGQVSVLSTDVAAGDDSPLPNVFALDQNYPNPFNPSTKITFSLPAASEVSLKIFNVLGQSVTTLASGELAAGPHTYEWDAAGYPSGVYFYRLDASQGTLTRKMMLLK